jgi:hypothetical protein
MRDEHIDPHDDELREIADAIREARLQPTPLELDELKRRARRQAEDRRGAAAPWRKRLLAGVLALGLMLTSATGVVVAGQSVGKKAGKGKPDFNFASKFKKPKKDASESQYCPPTRHDDSDSDSSRDRDSDSDCDGSDSDSDRPRGDRDSD